jgi:transposase-like protein
MACQDWASTKAAYRFFSNDRVDENEILSGHFQSTRDRFSAADGLVLVLHDTTAFSFQRDAPDEIGATFKVNSGKDKAGRLRQHTVCGILMHSSLIVTTEGLPVGIVRSEILDEKAVQGNERAQEKNQSDASSYWRKREHAVDRQH